MTTSPFETRLVKPRPDLPPYELNTVCAAPRCENPVAHNHHILRRSAVGISDDYWWVELPDGTLVPVRIGLDFSHHEDVTGRIGGYRAHIKWNGRGYDWHAKGKPPRPLDPQPAPLRKSLTFQPGVVA